MNKARIGPIVEPVDGVRVRSGYSLLADCLSFPALPQGQGALRIVSAGAVVAGSGFGRRPICCRAPRNEDFDDTHADLANEPGAASRRLQPQVARVVARGVLSFGSGLWRAADLFQEDGCLRH